MTIRLIKSIFFIILGIMFSGCMLGPDYERPETAAMEADSFMNAPSVPSDCNEILIGGPWWRQFEDPLTNQLVVEALEHNYDLQAAAARVIQTQALMEQTRGLFFPQINYGISRNRAKMSFNAPPPIGRQSFLSTTYGQELSISYVVDLFGKIRRSYRTAWNELLSAEASQEALQHTIVASVVRTRAQIATQQRLLAIATSNTQSWQDSLTIIERRYRNGLVSPLDVHLARENLANSKATEFNLQKTLKTTQLALDVLLGRRPGTSPYMSLTLAELPDLQPVPVGLPVGLLDRRPDLMAAEFRLAAVTERVGVSIAQLFPDFTLTGNYGFRDDEFRFIWNDQSNVYSLTMQLMQPVFQGGQLMAQVKGAKARVEEEAANYSKVVLQALQEVEDALMREELLQEQMKALEVRFREAQAAEKLAGQRYLQGVDSVILALETERRRRISENELAITKGQIWQARIDLFLALGGDWGDEKPLQDAKIKIENQTELTSKK